MQNSRGCLRYKTSDGMGAVHDPFEQFLSPLGMHWPSSAIGVSPADRFEKPGSEKHHYEVKETAHMGSPPSKSETVLFGGHVEIPYSSRPLAS